MRSQAAWQALTRRNLLVTLWPWRSIAYLMTSAVVGAVMLVVVLVSLISGALLALVLVGIPLLVVLGLSGIPVGALERRRLWIIDSEPVESPHRVPDQPGLVAWARLRFSEQATWRELAYTGLLITVLWPMELLAVVYGIAGPMLAMYSPIALEESGEFRLLKFWLIDSYPEAFAAALLGAVLLALFIYPLTALAVLHGILARLLLGARETDEAQRVIELTRSRTRLVEAFEAERRRIERDLHDGAQQRLVSLTMTLGLAKLTRGDERTDLVHKAHGQAKLALAEIRDLIRGIHPQILTDRGLPAAVADVADRSPVPVEVSMTLPSRLPEAVEATAYFVVSEALANTARHSDARQASVTGRMDGDRLVVEIGDDGVGGADAAAGTGLAGLADRVSVVNGRLMLSSPVGGPTLLRVEIPCASIDPSR
ncbi:sensor histidine kinase [Streptosporangium sp. 'caverna']|uniref:sensor histidine kinase n=1 Tax=Streptosporangium sp. 'caverna' TaxID=2202249 RepID=UPI001EF99FFE|nr:sensor histidine kinase [Streptosporangium sp. 'caverna']